MVKSFPGNEKLWEQYPKLRSDSLRAGNGGKEATDFYVANREAMDEGFEPCVAGAFKARTSQRQQHAMNLRLDLGDFAFFAEYQNAPLIEQQGEELLTPAEIAKKRNGQKRGDRAARARPPHRVHRRAGQHALLDGRRVGPGILTATSSTTAPSPTRSATTSPSATSARR
jgi:hypothetical protein